MSTNIEPTPPADVELSPDRLLRAVLATDFAAFIEYSFGLLRPGVEYRPNWHIEAMAYKLAQVARGEVKRLIITVPPRNLKSICASVALPAWFLGHNPSERVVAISYSDSLAKTHANDFRRVVTDPLYQRTFPQMRVSRDTDSEIHTTSRGRRYATSIGGTLTGRGGNLVIIDDPLKPGDADSEAVRERVIEWYRSTLVTRADDKKAARIVVVMQRVHVDDLVGYLQEQNAGFQVLNLPAIAQSTRTYDLGHGRTYTRHKGEILHPAHESAETLLELKKSMGSLTFSAQYQQSPEPPAGKIVKRKHLKYYSGTGDETERDNITLSWDIALSEREGGDYSAGIALLNRGETYYVLEVIRGQFPFPELKDRILAMKRRYRGRPNALVIEDSPISLGLIQALEQQNINVVSVKPNKDKRARLIHQMDLIEGGSLLLPKQAPWLDEFVAELLSFPGRHDDQVDALTQGLAFRREFRPITQRQTVGI